MKPNIECIFREYRIFGSGIYRARNFSHFVRRLIGPDIYKFKSFHCYEGSVIGDSWATLYGYYKEEYCTLNSRGAQWFVKPSDKSESLKVKL